jgi:hypothetical protein
MLVSVWCAEKAGRLKVPGRLTQLQYNITSQTTTTRRPIRDIARGNAKNIKKFANLNILGNLLDMWQSNQFKSQESYNVTQRWTLSHVRLTTHTTVISLCRPTRTSTTGHNNGRLRGIKTAVTLTRNFVIKFNVAYNQCYFSKENMFWNA